jgi:hypothetical protein
VDCFIQPIYGKFGDDGDGLISDWLYHIGLTGQASHVQTLGTSNPLSSGHQQLGKAPNNARQVSRVTLAEPESAETKPTARRSISSIKPPCYPEQTINSPIFRVPSADDCESTDWDNACSLGSCHGATGGSSMRNFDLQNWLVWDVFNIEPSYFAVPFKRGKWC